MILLMSELDIQIQQLELLIKGVQFWKKFLEII
jgi:hypothetical protein